MMTICIVFTVWFPSFCSREAAELLGLFALEISHNYETPGAKVNTNQSQAMPEKRVQHWAEAIAVSRS
jgi:hypothetical protein